MKKILVIFLLFPIVFLLSGHSLDERYVTVDPTFEGLDKNLLTIYEISMSENTGVYIQNTGLDTFQIRDFWWGDLKACLNHLKDAGIDFNVFDKYRPDWWRLDTECYISFESKNLLDSIQKIKGINGIVLDYDYHTPFEPYPH